MKSKIIGLCGPKGCGKSTLAELLVACGYVPQPFAAPLKAMLHALLSIQGLDEQGIDAMLNGHAKEIPTRFLRGRTPRHAMQTLGTEWGRELIASDFWIHCWEERARRTLSSRSGSGTYLEQSIVTDDLRFHNEAAVVHNLGGVIVGFTTPWSSDAHISEQEARDIVPDFTINNPDGKPGAMIAQLRDKGLDV